MNRQINNDGKVIEILLAEDNDDDCVMIKEGFEDKKFLNIIDVVKDGEEVLTYLRQEGNYREKRMPGLVLLDINMPKKTGLEALQEIKDDPKLKHIPVIVLTTSSREEDIVKSYQYGACSYLNKPVEFEDFFKVVERFELYWALVSKIPNPARSSG